MGRRADRAGLGAAGAGHAARRPARAVGQRPLARVAGRARVGALRGGARARRAGGASVPGRRLRARVGGAHRAGGGRRAAGRGRDRAGARADQERPARARTSTCAASTRRSAGACGPT